ncbi:hypothetical protein, partial [Chitinophaga sp. GbtcB8]|uniref:hypothetical protein n=1 Tax=Chitinophaga sp. GbtcB8 TaxID=2824753 RepID=UPI001C2F6A87
TTLLKAPYRWFTLRRNGGSLCPEFTNGKEIGEVAEYPTLDTHQNEAVDYIKERSTKNTDSTGELVDA